MKCNKKLETLKQDNGDIISKYSTDIRLNQPRGVLIETDAEQPPAASKPYLLSLKDHECVKEGLEN